MQCQLKRTMLTVMVGNIFNSSNKLFVYLVNFNLIAQPYLAPCLKYTMEEIESMIEKNYKKKLCCSPIKSSFDLNNNDLSKATISNQKIFKQLLKRSTLNALRTRKTLIYFRQTQKQTVTTTSIVLMFIVCKLKYPVIR